jgi:hypothetical protein
MTMGTVDPTFIRTLSYHEREKIFGPGFDERKADEAFVESILHDDEITEAQGQLAKLKFKMENTFSPVLRMLGA